jgi:Mitochondrial branched-chain alpha-ketoacid dehydrogenase kinase
MRIGQNDLSLNQRRGRVGQRLEAERILMKYAQMLQKELPIRLARRVIDLENVPKLRDMPSIKAVKGIYISSLLAILDAEDPNERYDTEIG